MNEQRRPMRNCYRVMLGQGSAHAKDCFAGGFIGVDFGIPGDLTGKFPENWQAFNKEYIPIYLEAHPGKTRIGAGLACGNLWTLAKGMQEGDLVMSPDGSGRYRVATVTGPYFHAASGVLPHRRPVAWSDHIVDKADLTDSFRKSASSLVTVVNITAYLGELDHLLSGTAPPTLVSTDETVEDPVQFALEKHLEDFLVANWAQTDLGKEYDIYEENGERVGQQYPTDTGPLDILAIRKDRKELLVVELKKGRASDAVVGQTLRYMGFVQDQLCEEGQTASGVIIALEDDQRIRRALEVTPRVKFYRYEIKFKLLAT